MCEGGKCAGEHHHGNHVHEENAHPESTQNATGFSHDHHDHCHHAHTHHEETEHDSESSTPQKTPSKAAKNRFSALLKSSCYALLTLLAALYLWRAIRHESHDHFPITAYVKDEVKQLFVELSDNTTNPNTIFYQMIPGQVKEGVAKFVLEKKSLALKNNIVCSFYSNPADKSKSVEMQAPKTNHHQERIYEQTGVSKPKCSGCKGHGHGHGH